MAVWTCVMKNLIPQDVFFCTLFYYYCFPFSFIFLHVLTCSLFYRYVEAIREFNKILLYIYKTKQYHNKSPQYEQILKKNEQMYALLAICLSLCPQSRLVDETVNSQLREKYGEKMGRMQRYDDEAFAMYDELFSYACPKFITPSAPSFDEPLVNYNQVYLGFHLCSRLTEAFFSVCVAFQKNFKFEFSSNWLQICFLYIILLLNISLCFLGGIHLIWNT